MNNNAIAKNIEPPRDLKTSPERRRRAILNQKRLSDSIVNLKISSNIFCQACHEMISDHLYMEFSARNYKEYFLRLNISPEYAIGCANVYRQFRDHDFSNIPLNRLLKLISQPAEELIAIKKMGVKTYFMIKEKEKKDNKQAKIEANTAKSARQRQTNTLAVNMKKKLKDNNRNDRAMAKANVEYQKQQQEVQMKTAAFENAIESMAELVSDNKAFDVDAIISDQAVEQTQNIILNVLNVKQHANSAAYHMKALMEALEKEADIRPRSDTGGGFAKLIEDISVSVSECRRYCDGFMALEKRHGRKGNNHKNVDSPAETDPPRLKMASNN